MRKGVILDSSSPLSYYDRKREEFYRVRLAPAAEAGFAALAGRAAEPVDRIGATNGVTRGGSVGVTLAGAAGAGFGAGAGAGAVWTAGAVWAVVACAAVA